MNMQKLFLISLCLFPYQYIQADYSTYLLLSYGLDYPRRLEMRRNMPESKDEYFKRIEAGLKHLDKHLEKTVKDDYDWHITGPIMRDLKWEIDAKWKRSWWDHNPGWSDLALTASIVTVLGIIIAALSSPDSDDAYIPPAPDGDNEPGANNVDVPPAADVPPEA